jgi:hypothetical protein
MGRTPRLALSALTLLLVVFPLTLARPGVPSGLKADEPAYFAMALSLARDGDLRLEPADLRRLVEAFPFSATSNLILMSDDGWRTVYFGKPYAYSLFAAPAAALAGAGGMIAFNMALAMAMVWLGALYLAQHNPGGVAALFSAGFFLVSAGFAYAFWLHPEVFNMAAVTLSLFLLVYRFGPPAPARSGWGRWGRLAAGLRGLRRALWNEATRPGIAGAALGLAVYNKPMVLALGLPALYLYGWRRRRLGSLAAWVLGLGLSLGGLAAGAWALTGHTTAYMGVARGSFQVCDPDEMPVLPAEPAAEAPGGGEAGGGGAVRAPEPPRASWWWILGVPDLRWHELAENLGYFFVGRHTGLFLYFPFALVSCLLFLFHGRRSGLRWTVAAGLAAVALFFLLWIPFNWHGGGGFIGNRYFVNVYPAFLFLVTRIAPLWSAAVGYLLGGVFLGSVLFTPLGRAVVSPTLQFHVRNPPFRLFPVELSLRQIPGYETVNLGAVQIRGREDQVLPRGDSLWLRGADRSEVWFVSVAPLERLLFSVTSFAGDNRVELELPGDRAELDFDGARPGERTRLVELAPSGPSRVRWSQGYPLWVYRLEARIATGEVRKITVQAPPERCEYFSYNASWEDSFFVGAELTYLGTREGLERDVFAAEWRGARVPRRAAAGERFTVASRLANTSRETWPARGAVRVNLSYHWLDEDGRTVAADGPRTGLGEDLPPGGVAVVRQEVLAPEEPGVYTLVLEPLYEHVAWFSDRAGDAATHRARVRVVPPERMAGPPARAVDPDQSPPR